MNKSPYSEAVKRSFKFRRDTMIELYAELPTDKQEAFRLEYPTGADTNTIETMIARLEELKYG